MPAQETGPAARPPPRSRTGRRDTHPGTPRRRARRRGPAHRPARRPGRRAPASRAGAPSGRLDGGACKVRCEMGNVTINLEKGSSVKVTARTTMGKVAVDSGGAEPMFLGQSGKEVTVGTGEGTLDIDCTMGNVRVSA